MKSSFEQGEDGEARVFIPPLTTAKTLVAAGHVNPQILGVIRIIAPPPLGTWGGVRREIVSKVLPVKNYKSKSKQFIAKTSLNLRSILVRMADLKTIFFVDFFIYFVNMSRCLSFLRLL